MCEPPHPLVAPVPPHPLPAPAWDGEAALDPLGLVAAPSFFASASPHSVPLRLRHHSRPVPHSTRCGCPTIPTPPFSHPPRPSSPLRPPPSHLTPMTKAPLMSHCTPPLPSPLHDYLHQQHLLPSCNLASSFPASHHIPL
jgi:hypothetical protein